MFRRLALPGLLAGTMLSSLASVLGPLQAQQPGPQLAAANPVPRPAGTVVLADPIVIPNATATVVEKQSVPALRDGALDFIGTEVKPGAVVPAGVKTWKVVFPDGERVYRELKEGDVVQEGDLLGMLDVRLPQSDVKIKASKVKAAEADALASERTRDEALARYQTQQNLHRNRATSEEDLRGAWVTYQRYLQEAISKKEAIDSAKAELEQANTILELHELRAKISGQIKAIHKKKGEAVKNLETVFEIENFDRIRLVGKVEARYRSRLERGMAVVIEPRVPQAPLLTKQGHIKDITGLAISSGDRPLIVSASKDGTVRVWDKNEPHALRVLRHPKEVKAVACSPRSSGHLCLTGGSDGIARLWDLDSPSDQPLRELTGGHRGKAINAVAFSPDGKLCATGGEDWNIRLWYVASSTEEVPQRLTAAHQGPVTSLQFLEGNRLLSASQGTLKLWQVTSDGLREEWSQDRRGDVAQVVASTDGKRVLVDLGSEIRVVAMPKGTIEARLKNTGTDGGRFSGLALFSPKADLALTAGMPDGKLQLWRLPTATNPRAYELRLLEPLEKSPATCGAFAPDGSFVVTGNKDGEVYVWALPTQQQIERQLVATIISLDPEVDTHGTVRILAELDNREHQLTPGLAVTMVVYPR